MSRSTVKRIACQLVFLIVVAAGLWFLAGTAMDNLDRRNLASDFSFLDRPANFNMGEALVEVQPTDSYRWALLAAFLNSLAVSACACVFATVLGVTLAGLGSVKGRFFRGFFRTYIEIFRNTPLLLQLFVWYTLLQKLPAVGHAIRLGDFAVLSQRGFVVPSLSLDLEIVGWIAVLAAAGGLAAGIAGRRLPSLGRLRGYAPAGVALALLAAVAAAGTIERPQLAGLNFRGGWHLSPEFLALLIGLSTYTAAFIAEIVRSGIEAVPPGQWEAASSLGLGPLRRFRLVVMPQALRVAIPPLVSEYGGIVKNSSLAVAIGFPDLVWATNTTIAQTGQAIQGVLILMAAYLSVSLSISCLLNLVNARMQARYA